MVSITSIMHKAFSKLDKPKHSLAATKAAFFIILITFAHKGGWQNPGPCKNPKNLRRGRGVPAPPQGGATPTRKGGRRTWGGPTRSRESRAACAIERVACVRSVVALPRCPVRHAKIFSDGSDR